MLLSQHSTYSSKFYLGNAEKTQVAVYCTVPVAGLAYHAKLTDIRGSGHPLEEV